MVNTIWRKRFIAVATLILLSSLGAGCDDDDGHGGGANPTSTQTPTLTSTPTATPTPEEDVHTEAAVGSTQVGGGEIKAEYEFDEPIHAHFSACLGGTTESCDDGVAIYTSVSPGFESIEEDEPDGDHFTLIDGTPVTLTVVSIDSGLSLRMEEMVIDAAGQTLFLGEAPFHADVEAQVAVDSGAVREDGWKITFNLSTDSGAYQPSEDYTLTYVLAED